MNDTRIKINFAEGTIELEGSEQFVEKHWEELKSYIPKSFSDVPKSHDKNNKSKIKGASKIQKDHKPLSYTPIPINLKGAGNTPSLKKFFDEKSPTSNQDIVTVFVYYLNKYCDIKNMEMGHAVSCYNELKLRKPSNIYSVCNNVRTRKGYLDYGDEAHTFKINIQGENLIEHDLPVKKQNKPQK